MMIGQLPRLPARTLSQIRCGQRVRAATGSGSGVVGGSRHAGRLPVATVPARCPRPSSATPAVIAWTTSSCVVFARS